MSRMSRAGTGLLAAVLLLLAVAPARAHRVVAAVFLEDGVIEGEVALAGGQAAQPGLPVEVFGPDDEHLGDTVTETGGLFHFEPTRRIAHHFVVDLGMGHVARAVMPAGRLPESLPGPAPRSDETSPTRRRPAAAAEGLDEHIHHAVREEVRPLRRELAAFKEEVRFRDVLGGLGYILGLTGIAAWVAARRRA